MRKIIIFLLGIFALSACSSLEDDYTELDRGTVIAFNDTKAEITLRHQGQSDSISYHLASPYDDMSVWFGEYKKQIVPNDEVWIYQKDGLLVASTVNIMQARRIKTFLRDYNLPQFFNWHNVSLTIGVVILLLIWFLWSDQAKLNGAKLLALIVFWIACGGYMSSKMNTGYRLGYEGEGQIANIKGHVIQTVDKQTFYVKTLNDLCYQQTITRPQYVYFYRYGHKGEKNHTRYISGEIVFVSSQKINLATLDKSQTYPNLFWKALGFSGGLFIILIIAWAWLYTPVSKWHEKHPKPAYSEDYD